MIKEVIISCDGRDYSVIFPVSDMSESVSMEVREYEHNQSKELI